MLYIRRISVYLNSRFYDCATRYSAKGCVKLLHVILYVSFEKPRPRWNTFLIAITGGVGIVPLKIAERRNIFIRRASNAVIPKRELRARPSVREIDMYYSLATCVTR